MNDKYTKSWYWGRERDESELIKRKVATGMPEPEAVALVRPCDRRISSVITRLYWWKSANRFDVHFDIDGSEPQINVWFILPWLFGISFTFNCNWAWFKRTFPQLLADDASITWSIALTREYFALYWASREDAMWSNRQGFRRICEWGDLLRGRIKRVEWLPVKLVAEKDIQLHVLYRSQCHPHAPCVQPTRVRVYNKTGIWRFTRWFPKRHTRYEVACDRVFMVPGKGENSWDCGDYEWSSKWDEETQSAGYSTGSAKNADEAIAQFIAAFNITQRRR